MTTNSLLGQGVRSDVELVRLRINLAAIDPNSSDENLRVLAEAVDGVEALVEVAILLARFQGPPRSLSLFLGGSRVSALDTKVVTLSKASPLDLLLELPLVLGPAAAGAYGLAAGMIRLHNAYQEARVTKAKAEADIALYKYVADRMPSVETNSQQPRGDQDKGPREAPTVDDELWTRGYRNYDDKSQLFSLLKRAADLLNATESVEIPED